MNLFRKELLQFHRKGIKFIQIGANDGTTRDDLADVIKKYRWSGLFVEPMKKPFDKLKSKYKNREDLFFENVAIHPNKDTCDIYSIDKWSPISSINKKHIIEHKRFINATHKPQIKRYTVQASTLDSLICKYELHNFDWLHIDTEGFDYKVLQSISLNEYRPKIIHYEYFLLGKQNKQCIKYLNRHGYKVLCTEVNDIIMIRE